MPHRRLRFVTKRRWCFNAAKAWKGPCSSNRRQHYIGGYLKKGPSFSETKITLNRVDILKFVGSTGNAFLMKKVRLAHRPLHGGVMLGGVF